MRLAVELTTVLEVVLEIEDIGVLQGVPSEVLGSSTPCVYRRGGLNFVNGALGGMFSRSEAMRVSARFEMPYAVTHMGGIATAQQEQRVEGWA